MKILITGGAGFIGSHLVDAYLERGDEVLILDDLSSGSTDNLEGSLKRGARLFEMSVVDPKVAQLLKDEKPDLVNHHAAQKNVRDSVKNPLNDAHINILGLINIVKGSIEAGAKRFIFASTGGAIYGEQNYFPADEMHKIQPDSPYGLSKRVSEEYLNYFSRTSDIQATCLRYSNVFGPRQDPFGEAGVVSIFVKQILADQPITIFGDGKQTRDFVFVSDVVQANLLSEKLRGSFEIFNIGTSQETSVLELTQVLFEIMKHKVPINHSTKAAGDISRSALSSKLFEKHGWMAKTSLADGLRSVVDWAKNKSTAAP